MRFDLVDLQLFVTVAESGSITQGAARAGLALASASARIRGLEDRLGVALLERRRRGIALTPAGRALLHHAQTVQSQIERMTGELGLYARGLRARVRLLSNTAAAAELLPDRLAGFLVANPAIDVELDERPSHAILDAVAGGGADLGVAIATPGFGHLAQRPFALDRLVVVAARDSAHVLEGRSVAFDAVAGGPFVGLCSGIALQDYVVRQAAHLGHHLTFRIQVATLDAVARLVASGIGLAIMPEAAARRLGRPHRLRSLHLRDAWATRELKLYARDFAALPPHAQLLADALAGDG